MKAFKFRLQTVLTMRQREEEARALELAEALRSLEQAQKVLNELRIREADAMADYQQLQREGRLDVQTIQWFQTYSMRLSIEIREQEKRVGEAEARSTERRGALMQAAQAKQVLEQLKKQAKATYQKTVDQAEAKLIDEIATIRHFRQG